MVQAKTELFTKESQQISEVFKALAHPARIEILRFLAEKKCCYSGNVSEELPLGRTTVNQHLSELKRVGLIKGTVTGARINYCLNPEKIDLFIGMIGEFIGVLSLSDINKECR